MNERLDTVLKWSIWIYGFLCLMSLMAEFDRQEGGLWNVVASITFLDCGLYGSDFCEPIYFEGMSFLLLAILVAARYIMFGKNFER